MARRIIPFSDYKSVPPTTPEVSFKKFYTYWAGEIVLIAIRTEGWAGEALQLRVDITSISGSSTISFPFSTEVITIDPAPMLLDVDDIVEFSINRVAGGNLVANDFGIQYLVEYNQ